MLESENEVQLAHLTARSSLGELALGNKLTCLQYTHWLISSGHPSSRLQPLQPLQ